MKIKASFVIPAYNAETYLAQTLASCQTQSVKDAEIIVVNDGSTDGTHELVEWEAKSDKRIRLIDIEKSGRSAARNVGNAAAQSDFILVLDADDIALKNRVRDTLLHFQMKNCDVLYGPFQVIDELGNVIGTQSAGEFNREISLKEKKNFIGHSTMAYRKGVTMNVHYDEGKYSDLGLDDWRFQWDCILKGYKIGFTKVALSKYRIYQLPNGTYGSPTEFCRDEDAVKKLKDEFIAGIALDHQIKA